MRFKLLATHKPTGQTVEYGPWPYDEDEQVREKMATFAHGFVSGVFFVQYDALPGDADFHLVELPDAPDVPGVNVIGELVAHASASVTHADGTVS